MEDQTPKQKSQATTVPRDVLEADLKEAARTGRLPADPDRSAAVLQIVEIARILQSIYTQ